MESLNEARYERRVVSVFLFFAERKKNRWQIPRVACTKFHGMQRSTNTPFLAGRQETGKAKLYDLSCPCRSVTAVRPEMLQRDFTIVHEDRRIATPRLATILLISKGSVVHTIRDAGYSNDTEHQCYQLDGDVPIQIMKPSKKKGHSSPITGLEWPRGFKEVNLLAPE